MLTNPLRDRFGIVARLEFYSDQELTAIVTRSARLLKATLHAEEAGGTAFRRACPEYRHLSRTFPVAEGRTDWPLHYAGKAAVLGDLFLSPLLLMTLRPKLGRGSPAAPRTSAAPGTEAFKQGVG